MKLLELTLSAGQKILINADYIVSIREETSARGAVTEIDTPRSTFHVLESIGEICYLLPSDCVASNRRSIM